MNSSDSTSDEIGPKKQLRKIHPNAKEICAEWKSCKRPREYQILNPSTVMTPEGRLQYINLDDMGLGKTATTIVNIATHLGKDALMIVVAPGIVMSNWTQEYERFWPHQVFNYRKATSLTDAVIVDGNDPILHPTNKIQLIAVSYDQLLGSQNYERLVTFATCKKVPVVLIVDEVHNVNNPNTNRTIQVLRFRNHFQHVVLLSGTPMLNKFHDLQTLYVLLGRGISRFPEFWRPLLEGLTDERVKHVADEIDKFTVKRNRRSEEVKGIGACGQVISMRNNVEMSVCETQGWAVTALFHDCGIWVAPNKDTEPSSENPRIRIHGVSGSVVAMQAQFTTLNSMACLHPLLARTFLVATNSKEREQKNRLPTNITHMPLWHKACSLRRDWEARITEQRGEQAINKNHTYNYDISNVHQFKNLVDLESHPSPHLDDYRHVAAELYGYVSDDTLSKNPLNSFTFYGSDGTDDREFFGAPRHVSVGCATKVHKKHNVGEAVSFRFPSVFAALSTSFMCQYFTNGPLVAHIVRGEKVMIYMERVDPAIVIFSVLEKFYLRWYMQDLTKKNEENRVFQNHDKPPRVTMLNGRMNASDLKANLEKFRTSSAKESPLVIITRVGSVGVNIPEATVVYVDPIAYHVENANQAENRNNRFDTPRMPRAVHIRGFSYLSETLLLLQYMKKWLSNQILHRFTSTEIAVFPTSLQEQINPQTISQLLYWMKKIKAKGMSLQASPRLDLRPKKRSRHELSSSDDDTDQDIDTDINDDQGVSGNGVCATKSQSGIALNGTNTAQKPDGEVKNARDEELKWNMQTLHDFTTLSNDALFGFLMRTVLLAAGPMQCRNEIQQGGEPFCGIEHSETLDEVATSPNKNKQPHLKTKPPKLPHFNNGWMGTTMPHPPTNLTDIQLLDEAIHKGLLSANVKAGTASPSSSNFPAGIGYPLECTESMVKHIQDSFTYKEPTFTSGDNSGNIKNEDVMEERLKWWSMANDVDPKVPAVKKRKVGSIGNVLSDNAAKPHSEAEGSDDLEDDLDVTHVATKLSNFIFNELRDYLKNRQNACRMVLRPAVQKVVLPQHDVTTRPRGVPPLPIMNSALAHAVEEVLAPLGGSLGIHSTELEHEQYQRVAKNAMQQLISQWERKTMKNCGHNSRKVTNRRDSP
jgi:hypothetical protein